MLLKPLLMSASLTVLVAACSDSGPIASADPTNARAVEMGKSLYAAHCAECHGADLKGHKYWQSRKPDGTLPPPPHDDSGHTWHHPDDLLFTYTKLGGKGVLPANVKTAMPAFGDVMSDEEIWAVLSFIKSKWSPESRAFQRKLNN